MNLTKDYNKGDFDERLAEREWMVQTQLIDRDITDEAVINSMLIVPRHKYVMEDKQEYSYYDTALEIEAGQTISQPYIVALMAQALELKESDIVLEIGTGSGYSAAILSRMAATSETTISSEVVVSVLVIQKDEAPGFHPFDPHCRSMRFGTQCGDKLVRLSYRTRKLRIHTAGVCVTSCSVAKGSSAFRSRAKDTWSIAPGKVGHRQVNRQTTIS